MLNIVDMCPVVQPCGAASWTIPDLPKLFPTCMNPLQADHMLKGCGAFKRKKLFLIKKIQ